MMFVKQAITINIVNFRCFHSTERYHTAYHVTEDVDRFRLSDVLEIHFVEMPKFRQARKNRISLQRSKFVLDIARKTCYAGGGIRLWAFCRNRTSERCTLLGQISTPFLEA